MTTGDLLFFGLFATPLGIYVLLFIGALVVAFKLPKGRWKKVAAVVVVLMTVTLPLAYDYWKAKKRNNEARARYEESNALFQERCKTAGERIVRTVDNVDGILLLKVRPENWDLHSQFAMTDPYGFDLMGDAYIKTFLHTWNEYSIQSKSDVGYTYVEVTDAKTGQTHRYTGTVTKPRENEQRTNLQLLKVPVPDVSARYGVTYDDISTPEDRQHWIAGSSLKIVDVATNEVIAERIGYMMDPAQGRSGTGADPWLRATNKACPTFKGRPPANAQIAQAARFASKAVVPQR